MINARNSMSTILRMLDELVPRSYVRRPYDDQGSTWLVLHPSAGQGSLNLVSAESASNDQGLLHGVDDCM